MVVFRLVCRGTIEEIKYLRCVSNLRITFTAAGVLVSNLFCCYRQVYKVQLKQETITENNGLETEEETAARLFNGMYHGLFFQLIGMILPND